MGAKIYNRDPLDQKIFGEIGDEMIVPNRRGQGR